MPRFAYTAIEQNTGRELSGILEARSREVAATELKTRGLVPLEIKAVEGRTPANLKRPLAQSMGHSKKKATFVVGRIVGPKELAVFTRQLSALVKAGMPLLRSLEVLARQERNKPFRLIIERLGEQIRSGGTLSDGLQQYPKVFDRLYINMVRAGESGGVLAVVLERLAQFQEKSVRLNGRLRAAMTYPCIIMIVAVGIVAALMIFVVPKFQTIFETTLKGQALPPLTQVVITASHFLKDHVLLAVLFVAGLIIALRIAVRSTRGGRVLDTLSLRVPVLGDLLRKTAIARFARTFGTLLPGGVPILDALRITRETSGNVCIAEAITVVHDRVKGGDSVAAPLRATRIFPDMVPSMVEVGEETGALPEMLIRIADNYDEEVDSSVNALTSLIEPLMIVVMAVMVGTIVIALFLPIVRIIQSLG